MLLYRYWLWRSWNITFRWTAKRVIFYQGIIFSRSAQHWGKILSRGKILLSWHHRHVIFHPSRSISVILDGQNEWFPQNCMCSTTPQSLVTRLGVCVQNKTERKLDSLRTFYYDVLLLTTAYSAYAVHFFLGQFPNMELMLLLSPLFYLLNRYIFCDCVTLVDITQFLTGCLCALNYMSKLDHLISSFNNVPLRTRKPLLPYKVNDNSTLLVLNRTLLNSVNALLVLSWWNVLFTYQS